MMPNEQPTDETTPTTDNPTPNGNIGVGSPGEDMGSPPPEPLTPAIGHAQPATDDEPGLVGREESGVQGEPKSGFTGDEPHLPGQTAEPGNPDTSTHYLPEGESKDD
jgi:hypothetical protein